MGVGRHYRTYGDRSPEGWWPWMTILIVVLAVGGGVAIWLVFRGGGSPPPPSPSAQSPQRAAATQRQALRFVHDFATARVDADNVAAFVTPAVGRAYRNHAGGLSLYRYAGLDISSYYLFHFETLAHGHYLAAIDLNLAKGNGKVEEDLILGPGRNADGKDVALVVQQAELRKG